MAGITLLKKLISIPSYLEDDINEARIGNFIYDYLKEFPWLKVERQFIGKGRFNVIARDKYPAELLIYGHMDTVTPRSHSVRDQFKPTVVGNKLYGLGAVDMKAGLAAMFTAIKNVGPTRGLVALFSCDEEYEFLGTKKFLEKYNFSPKLVLSAETTDLCIANNCRGVLEATFTVEGKTAHASTPNLGKNAIDAVVKLVDSLKQPLRQFTNPNLGRTTMNLAYLNGGLVGLKQFEIIARANSVPDIAHTLLELRITDKKITPTWLEKIIKEQAKKMGLSISNFKTHFCVNPLLTHKNQLKELEALFGKTNLPVCCLEADKIGYYDVQLIQEVWGVPAVSVGPGPKNYSHKSNEYVDLQEFGASQTLYEEIIKYYCPNN